MSRVQRIAALGRRVGLDGQPREPCPRCNGTGMAPSEADVARSLVAYFAAAAEARGFEEPPPSPPPSVDEASWDPCRVCRGDLFVTARAVEEHRGAAAHSGAATTRRLAATADALRRCDVRWQRPLSEMSYVERLMTWWNLVEDATTGSPDGPSPSGAATSARSKLVSPASSLGRAGSSGFAASPGKNDDHDKGA